MNFRRHMRGAETPLFQVTPLLTVVFLLFCLYVAAAVFAPAGRELDLQALAPAAGQPGELAVELGATGTLTINRQALTLDELRVRLRQFALDVPESVVCVQADRDTPLTHILNVIDACRAESIDRYRVVGVPGGSTRTPLPRTTP